MEKPKEESKAAGLSEETSTGSPTNPQASEAASTILFNLTSALRSQHLNQIKNVLASLSISIDGSKCSLSTAPAVSLPGEIVDSEWDRIFASIKSKIESCLGSGDDRVKIKGIDLYDFEQDIEKALGDNIVKACSRDADCGRLPNGGYFRSGLGYIYSKKIQGEESFTLQERIKDLMVHLADEDITDMEEFTWAMESAPNPIPVPRCVSNVCKGVNP